MIDYLLKEDRPIGHEVVVYRKFPFGKQLELKTIYYNDLVRNCLSESASDNENYSEMRFHLDLLASVNATNKYSLRRGGYFIGKDEVERRVNALNFFFTKAYIENAEKIIDEKRNSDKSSQ
jgi:hypothetical protein